VVYQVVGYHVTIGSVQVVGFVDVTARLSAGDGTEKMLLVSLQHEIQ